MTAPRPLRHAAKAWLLLLRQPASSRALGAPKRTGGRARVRGVALLLVMVAVAILGTLSTEFAYEQRASIKSAVNAEMEVHAYFSARSAMEIARLVIISQKVANQYLGMARQIMPNLRNPRIELWAYACKFAEIFNSGKVDLFGGTLVDLAGQKGIGMEEGSFGCEAEPEEGRININQVGSLADKQSMFYRLYPVLRSLRGTGADEDDREAIQAILNIIDYSDEDDERTDVGPDGTLTVSGGGEGRAYLKVDYDPKNAMFDSTEELMMVPGIDEEMFCLLRDRVTPYLTERINVNTADLYTLRALICESLGDPALQQACQQSVVLGALAHPVDIALEWLDVCRQIKWSLFTPPFANAQDFVQFFQRLPPPLNTTLRLNSAQLLRNASTDARMIRVRATGTYGDCEDAPTFAVAPGEQATNHEERGDEDRPLRRTRDHARAEDVPKKGFRPCVKKELEGIIDTKTMMVVTTYKENGRIIE